MTLLALRIMMLTLRDLFLFPGIKPLRGSQRLTIPWPSDVKGNEAWWIRVPFRYLEVSINFVRCPSGFRRHGAFQIKGTFREELIFAYL